MGLFTKRKSEKVQAANVVARVKFGDLTDEEKNDEFVVADYARRGEVEYGELNEAMQNSTFVVASLAALGKVQYDELTDRMKNDPVVVSEYAKRGEVKYEDLTATMQKDWGVVYLTVKAEYAAADEEKKNNKNDPVIGEIYPDKISRDFLLAEFVLLLTFPQKQIVEKFLKTQNSRLKKVIHSGFCQKNL